MAQRASFMITASPLGEEETDPKEAERGGYSPIPRCEARAGEWETSFIKRRISFKSHIAFIINSNFYPLVAAFGN